MQSDDQGFLTGGTPLGLHPNAGHTAEALLVGVRHDTQGILALLRKHGAVVASQARARPKTVARPLPVEVAQVVQAIARQQPAGRVHRAGLASDRSAERMRDDRGRFIRAGVAQAEPVAKAVQAVANAVETQAQDRRQERTEARLRERDGSGRFQPKYGDDPSGVASRLGALGSVAGEAAGNALSGSATIDPTLAALDEVRGLASAAKSVASPVARGIGTLAGWGGTQEQKQTGWLKRIAMTLGWSRSDAKAHAGQQVRALRDVVKAAGQDKGGSWLLSMLPMLMSLLPGLLRRMLLPGAVARLLGSIPLGAGGAAGLWARAKGMVGLGGSGAAGALLGRGGSALRFLGRAPVIGTALTGLLAWMNDADIRSDTALTPEQRRQARGENFGGAVGSLAGGALGLVIGGPVGMAVGAWLGAEGGKLLGEPMMKVYDFISGLKVWDTLGDFVKDTEQAWDQFSGWVARKVGFEKRSISMPAAAPSARAAGAPAGGVAIGFESGGNPNAASSGKGDPGGPSYGLYQLSTNTGALGAFLAGSKYGAEFNGLQPGTPQFKKKWEEVNARDPAGFQFAQLEYIRKNNVEPARKALSLSGIDLAARGSAVQEMLFSTATQFGGAGAAGLITKALSGKSLPGLSDADIVAAVQDYKLANNAKLFRSSSPEIREGTARRAVAERAALIGRVAGAASMPAAALPNVPALNPPQARPVPPVPTPQPQEPASVPQRISAAAPTTVVVQPASAPPGQDVPDRGIAHVASGGIGWRGA